MTKLRPRDIANDILDAVETAANGRGRKSRRNGTPA
jgi:hypothetical protein